jgi:prepilin-type N-terminal cleavage/methylation domain-containing protein
MNLRNKEGFTLIELLVVIAIIGILSSVVLASLNTARDKGADAAGKANLNNARAQAELFYDNGNTYDGVCDSAGGIGSLVSAATSSVDGGACYDAPTEWAAYVNLKGVTTATDDVYCVDSSGFAGTIDDTISTSTCGQ